MKESYDAKKSLMHNKPGDLVLYGTGSSQLDVAPKLRMNMQGLILARLGDQNYRIQLKAKGKWKVVHHKVKPSEGKQSLPWAKSELKVHKPKTKFGPSVLCKAVLDALLS